jgi:phospholipase/lecithinase/hemolysin
MFYQTFLSKVSQGIIASTLPISLVAFTPNVAQAFNFSGLYVFGDSISDSGNVFSQTGGLVPPSPPYAARFSNGPVWVEYLAPYLGLPVNPANNFAFGGATTGTVNTLPVASIFNLPGLQQEVTSYALTNTADPHGLYVLFAGANDYLGAGVTNPVEPVQNLANAILTLAAAGAKNFLVPNLPNLGNLPGTNGTPQSTPLNLLTSAHNTLLAQTLSILDQQLDPSVLLIAFNLNALFQDAIANPATYGFTNVTNACLSLSPLSLCDNPNTYLFWDDLHPTTAGHQQIASAAFSTIEAVPEPPVTLGLLAFGMFLGGASAFKRRQQNQKFQPGVLLADSDKGKNEKAGVL